MPRPALYRLLAALYVTQFIGVGFLQVGLTGILREQGVSLEQLAALQGLGLVWALKFLWAPVVDRYGGGAGGHYRLWLLVCQALMVASLLGLLLVRPEESALGAITLVVAAFVLFSATQDIAADAVAVRLIDADHRGVANGIQVAGGYVGNILGGGLTVLLYDRFGWVAAVLVLVAMTAVALGMVTVFGERRYLDHVPSGGLARAYSHLWRVFGQQGSKRWAFLALPVLFIGVGAVYSLLTPALVDLGWSLTRVGLVTTVLASIPAALGAILGGWMINRWGRVLPVLTGSVVVVVATLALLPAFGGGGDDTMTTVAICVYLGAYALASAVIYTVNMDYARAESAGTDYTVLSSIALALSFVGGAVVLALAESMGYVPVALGSTALVVLGAALCVWHLRGQGTSRPRAVTESAVPLR